MQRYLSNDIYHDTKIRLPLQNLTLKHIQEYSLSVNDLIRNLKEENLLNINTNIKIKTLSELSLGELYRGISNLTINPQTVITYLLESYYKNAKEVI